MTAAQMPTAPLRDKRWLIPGLLFASRLFSVAPPLAGWLFDRRGDPYGPMVSVAAAGAAIANALFRGAKWMLMAA